MLLRVLIVLYLSACLVRADESADLPRDLTAYLTGAFTNSAQARSDRNFPESTLELTRINPDRQDGVWIYAEQALVGAKRHPHKQTVYNLRNTEDGSVECHLYELTDPVVFTGAGQDEAKSSKLVPANLRLREGCLIHLKRLPDGSYHGKTAGKGCSSSLRGASYATTEITISATSISIWERGYNAADIQVWGSLHGGHVFKRLE